MKHRRRGKAYIFNHECFDPSLGLSRRVGSSTDVSNLQIALYGLGFQVFGFNDLGVCDVRRIIQQRNFCLHFFVLHSLLINFFLNFICQLQTKITVSVIASWSLYCHTARTAWFTHTTRFITRTSYGFPLPLTNAHLWPESPNCFSFR